MIRSLFYTFIIEFHITYFPSSLDLLLIKEDNYLLIFEKYKYHIYSWPLVQNVQPPYFTDQHLLTNRLLECYSFVTQYGAATKSGKTLKALRENLASTTRSDD